MESRRREMRDNLFSLMFFFSTTQQKNPGLLPFVEKERGLVQHIDIVTLIPRFPLSANKRAMEVSNTKQSEFIMAEDTPSCMDLGVASQVNRLRCPLSSNLYAKFSACLRVPINWTIAKNCWCPSNFSCFSNTNLKWRNKINHNFVSQSSNRQLSPLSLN